MLDSIETFRQRRCRPSLQSVLNATSITSEVSTTLGGSVGFTQGEGFNATLDASVTITNSKTVCIAARQHHLPGDLPTGDTLLALCDNSAEDTAQGVSAVNGCRQVPFAIVDDCDHRHDPVPAQSSFWSTRRDAWADAISIRSCQPRLAISTSSAIQLSLESARRPSSRARPS